MADLLLDDQGRPVPQHLDAAGTTYEALKGANNGLNANIIAAIPAGTNNIGDVDVLTLPAIPAGSNLIGSVDINTMPAGVFSGTVEIDQTTPGTTNGVEVVAALPAGTNNIGDVDVASLPALPAGTNNIGDVDVLSLPALPAGTNNIGDVDVLSLPALPAGTNLLGSVGIDQTTPGTTNGVQVVAALPAGSNNIGDVDVASLPALAAGSNIVGKVYIEPVSVELAFSAVSVGATTTQIVAANSSRKFIRLTNISDETQYFKFGASAVMSEGLTLTAGATFEMGPELIDVRVLNGICASGSKSVTVVEG